MHGCDLYIDTIYASSTSGESGDEGPKLIERKYGKIPRDVYNISRNLHDALLGKSPEAEYKDEFMSRAPALNLTRAQIQRIRDTEMEVGTEGRRAKKRMFYLFRSKMLRQMVPCDDAKNLAELADALERELENGTSPPPSWYVFSGKNFGPRRIGLCECDNRGCYRIECEELKMSKCGGCGVPRYCSKECQKVDWKLRHKHVCKKANEDRDRIKKVSAMLEKFKLKG